MTANLAFAWLWILAGFASGAMMGMRFSDPNWLGGYSSWPRRLLRLGHISFFGLGLINLLFYFTLRGLDSTSAAIPFASWSFIAGGVLMPLCCLISSRRPKANQTALFATPVASLLVGGALTLYLIVKP